MRENVLQYLECGPWVDKRYLLAETRHREASNLIERNRSRPAAQVNRAAGRPRPDGGRDWRSDHRPEVPVHVIRRNDQNRPALGDFAADGRIERRPINLSLTRIR
jgi:hypothetical protein